jgi:Leucine-rich repeat (LRR) protein
MNQTDPASPKTGDIQPRVTNSEHIRALIAEAASTRPTEFSLAQQGLTEVPNEIREFEFLETLNLSHNAIRQIPGWLQELPRLKYLNLVRNPLESVPDIPGLKLDWEAYRRFSESLSLEHTRAGYFHRPRSTG